MSSSEILCCPEGNNSIIKVINRLLHVPHLHVVCMCVVAQTWGPLSGWGSKECVISMCVTMLQHSSSTGSLNGPGTPPCCCSLFGCGASGTPGGSRDSVDWCPAENNTTWVKTHPLDPVHQHQQRHWTNSTPPPPPAASHMSPGPAWLGPRCWSRAAARCWTRTGCSVRGPAEGGTATESTSSPGGMEPGNTPRHGQVHGVMSAAMFTPQQLRAAGASSGLAGVRS